MNIAERFRGCLLGLAVGDAIGTTVEFRSRGTFQPVTDMIGQGPFNLKPGEWTDDTSMALCLATSLISVGGFEPGDQMDRYCDWFEHGYLSSTGECFDIGDTVRQALNRYRVTRDPFSGSTNPMSAGNGSIMRLAPVPMFYYPDRDLVVHYSVESSRTTHGAPACLEACALLGDILFQALSGADKEKMLGATDPARFASDSVRGIARGEYQAKSGTDIRGTGYVVECLEAALWCFWHTSSFESAILTAANLGDDADTTAAVCGQVAGAFYGLAAIPDRWLKQLVMRKEIEELADRLNRGAP